MPELVKALLVSLRSHAVCVFRPAIPQRSLPSVALSALPDEVLCPFSNSDAKVLLFFDICKFLGKKMHEYVVKHKKETSKGLFSVSV